QVNQKKRASPRRLALPSLPADHLQRIGLEHHLAVFLGHFARYLDHVRDVRNDLRVLVGGEPARQLIHLAVVGEQGHRRALLRARRGAVGRIGRHLVVLPCVVRLVLHVAGHVDDAAFYGLGRRERRCAERGEEDDNHQSSERLAHTYSFEKDPKNHSLIRLPLGYCQCTLRQVVIPRHGPPDVLAVREAPDPTLGDGEIRIRVYAAGVNFADILARLGLYADAPKPPVVVGYEVSGIVEAVGPGVTRVREGDRVAALTRFGGYADCVVAPDWMAFPIPASIDPSAAAAIPVNYTT